MKKKILIFGAGAIGRGFVAPLFYRNNYEINFVDSNINLVNRLNKKKKYYAGIIKNNKYKLSKILINKSYNLNERIDVRSFDLVVSCVGIDNCYKNYKYYKDAKYLISCENDIGTISKLKKITRNKNIFFGIPDVITSNTAPKILKKDDLTVISEDESLYSRNLSRQCQKKLNLYQKKD